MRAWLYLIPVCFPHVLYSYGDESLVMRPFGPVRHHTPEAVVDRMSTEDEKGRRPREERSGRCLGLDT